VAVGDADYSEIQQYFRKALEIVTRTGAAPVALDVLLGWAMLLMGDEPGQAERVQAVELLTLVQYHSASQYETKEKANRLLAGWISALPLEVAKAAQFRGETFDLWETATELLEEV
jgi:hypothetical protein